MPGHQCDQSKFQGLLMFHVCLLCVFVNCPARSDLGHQSKIRISRLACDITLFIAVRCFSTVGHKHVHMAAALTPSCATQPHLALPHLALPHLALPHLALPHLALPTLPYPMPYPTVPYPTLPNPTLTCPVVAHPTYSLPRVASMSQNASS